MAIVVAELVRELTRLKREDHSLTKYDSHFSKWKVLIEPDDWENHSAGKESAARYRFENLPRSSGSGLYELAIYPTGSSRSDNPGKLDPDKVVVVYLGKADNIRTRLQQYGRTGSHLGRSCRGEKGWGCFQDVFSSGYSIAYRWVPTKNNADAQRKEDLLLNTYDYAWNRGSNGPRRHDEILEKLAKRASNRIALSILSRKHLPFLQVQVGIKINASKLLSQDDGFSKYAAGSYNFFGQVFKVNRSRPRLLLDHGGFNEKDIITCGVPLGDGSICRRPPVEGRKRCAQHKGKKSQPHKPCSESGVLDNGELNVHGEKIPSFDLVPSLVGNFPVTEQRSTICGVAMGDGSICRSQPISGRKRCDLHKGRKICSSNSGTTRYHTVPYSISASCDNETSGFDKASGTFLPRNVATGVASKSPVFSKGCDIICGVEFGDGSFCTKQPVGGRMRCEDHKGMSVTSLLSGSDAKSKSNALDTDSRSSSCNRNYGSSSSNKSICGEATCNGSFCQNTVNGNERCWRHLNNGNSSAQYSNCRGGGPGGGSSSSSICGAPTQDGSSCQRTVKGNEQCWQHLNNGNSSARQLSYDGGSSSSTSICGAPTQDGSSCQRTVKGNERCWQHLNNGNSSALYLNYGGGSCSSSSICGAPTQYGSPCQRTVKGNERCWQHSNYGSFSSSSSSIFCPPYSNYGGYSTSICGAPTRNGSFCRRSAGANGRCWQH